MNTRYSKAVKNIADSIIMHQDSFSVIRKTNQRFDLKKENQIGYLKSGEISIYRVEDNLLTISISAPAVIGLAQLLHDRTSYFMRCNVDSEIHLLDASLGQIMFSNLGLWKDAFTILSKHLHMYYSREMMINKPTVKSLVLEHLKFISEAGEEFQKKNSVYTFILSRNIVSRSAVHKAINELEADGTVSVKRGKLVYLSDLTHLEQK